MNSPNEESSTILQRLRSSDSVESLHEERRVAEVLQTLGWGTSHGFYYRDPIEKKYREGDVLARQIWVRSQRRNSYFVYLNLVVECKTLSGFHIVFSPPGLGVFTLPFRAWIGSEGSVRNSVLSTLHQSYLTALTLPKVMDRFERAAYPGGQSLVSSLTVPPLPRIAASAFRETNIGNEKELDKSVLWRASQSLRSAYLSMRREFLNGELGGFTGALKLAATRNESTSNAAMDFLQKSLRRIALYHPIIVVKCPLWISDGTRFEQVDAVRFLQVKTSGIVHWWVDVVTSSALEPFVSTLSAYYAHCLGRSRAEPVNMQALLERIEVGRP